MYSGMNAHHFMLSKRSKKFKIKGESMEWFISDTHFNHTNIIKFCNRPFNDVFEMNEAIIQNWNGLVKPLDTVYHLGDVGFGRLDDIIGRLHGEKILIVGSHDKKLRISSDQFIKVTPQLTINSHGRSITLNHYCMRVWPGSHYNTWHLFGHSHGRLAPIGKSWDVGVDANDFKPLSILDIIKIMESREDNPNLRRSRSDT